MSSKNTVPIDKEDLKAAWMVLENLAVSFDQIGSAFGIGPDSPNGAERDKAFLDTLLGYLNPKLVKAINTARGRLGQYLPDDEAEALSDQIPYWDYGEQKKEASTESA